MCANANDNQAVFGVSHYRVYNIGIRTIYFFEFKNCDQKSVFQPAIWRYSHLPFNGKADLAPERERQLTTASAN